MIRSLLLVFIVLFAAFGLGQKAKSIVGKWIPDAHAAANRMSRDMSITFLKDGTMTFTGFNTKGEGTYKVTGNKVAITATKRNGQKPGPHESTTTAEIAENGNALMVEVGGKDARVRLVRAASR